MVGADERFYGDVGGPRREVQGVHEGPGDLVTDPGEAGSEQTQRSQSFIIFCDMCNLRYEM